MTTRMKKIAVFAGSLAMAGVMAFPALTSAASRQIQPSDLGTEQIGNATLLGGGDVRATAANIINVALGFLGIIAVGIVLLGGFKYMISGGQEEKTTEAKQWIIAGVIGLAIILSAWAITSFVITNLLSATTQAPGTTP